MKAARPPRLAVALVVLGGRAWGGWFTFLGLGLLPLNGVGVATATAIRRPRVS